jgi:glucose/arabinose dehydrogenase
MRLITLGILFLAGAAVAVGAPGAASAAVQLDKISLPPGFEIRVLTDQVPNAREMAFGAKGTLFVGSMREGKVYAVTLDGSVAKQVRVIANGLQLPVGVAFRDGSLYVSAVSRILRYDDIEARLDNPPAPVVVNGDFPTDTHHGWKFIAFGPDGKLYVPVGAPCNLCDPDSNRYANISRMNADGSGREVYARGVRNSVGFDWHPVTRELWFTDNGTDMMGDEIPNDELNYAPKWDLHFGYPYCHQGDLPDPQFGANRNCAQYTPPAAKLGPHVAALGMRFYTGTMFPGEYRNNIFIAQQGSWNRSKKIGYRVMRAVIDNNRVVKYEVFAEGWLQGESHWGRPVDVLQMADGSLLVADDTAGVIYRIMYQGKK